MISLQTQHEYHLLNLDHTTLTSLIKRGLLNIVLYGGGSTLRSDPLPLYITFFWQKMYPFSTYLPLKMLPLTSVPVNKNKSLKKESYCNFRLTVFWGAHNTGIINKLKLNTRNKGLLFKTFWLSALRSVLTEAISAWTGLYYSWISDLWIAWILRKVSLFCGTYLYSWGPIILEYVPPPPPPHRVLDTPLLEASVLLSPISCFQPEWIIKQNGKDNYGVN